MFVSDKDSMQLKINNFNDIFLEIFVTAHGFNIPGVRNFLLDF